MGSTCVVFSTQAVFSWKLRHLPDDKTSTWPIALKSSLCPLQSPFPGHVYCTTTISNLAVPCEATGTSGAFLQSSLFEYLSPPLNSVMASDAVSSWEEGYRTSLGSSSSSTQSICRFLLSFPLFQEGL